MTNSAKFPFKQKSLSGNYNIIKLYWPWLMVSKKGLLFHNYLTLVRRKILLYFRAYSLFLPKVSIFFRTSPFCVFIVHKNCKILTQGKSCFFTANANIMYIYHELCQLYVLSQNIHGLDNKTSENINKEHNFCT